MVKIFNEKEHAEKMITEGKFLLGKINGYELGILAKHYFTLNNSIDDKKKLYNRSKIKNELIKFCNSYESKLENNKKRFDEVILRKMLNNSIEHGKKFDFIKIENLGITQQEYDTIKELNDIKQEKVAFIMIIIAKLNNLVNKEKLINRRKSNKKDDDKNNKYEDKFFVCNKHSQIFNLAKVKCDVKKRNKTFKAMQDLGMIGSTRKCNFEIKFVDKDTSHENIIEVNDLDEFVLLYCNEKGEKIGNCSVCNKLIELKSPNTLYCEECSKKVKREKNLKTWHENKDKYKN